MRKTLKLLSILLLIPQICFASAGRAGNSSQVRATSLSFSTPLSFGLWYKYPSGSSIAASVLSVNTAQWTGWYVSYAGTTVGCAVPVNNDFTGGATSGGSGGTNTWVYLTCVFVSSTDRKAYLNGANEGTSTTSKAPAAVNNTCVFASCRQSIIDNQAVSTAAYYEIYSKALSIPEINEIMWKPGILGDSQYLHWPMWGSDPELDLSGNARTGAINSTVASADGPPVMFGGGLPL